eukprot:3311175-Amphidinium_carterae.1
MNIALWGSNPYEAHALPTELKRLLAELSTLTSSRLCGPVAELPLRSMLRILPMTILFPAVIFKPSQSHTTLVSSAIAVTGRCGEKD